MMPRLTAIVLAALALPAAAQLPDPTRPPPDAYALPAGAGQAEAVVAAPVGPQLQSVLISRKAGGRQLAVISGRTVPLGGNVDGAKLIEIRSSSVVLQRGSRKEVLKLASAQTEKP
jgi:MSHA biogenesis protein MshK